MVWDGNSLVQSYVIFILKFQGTLIIKQLSMSCKHVFLLPIYRCKWWYVGKLAVWWRSVLSECVFSHLFGLLQIAGSLANGSWLITSANDFYSSISFKTSNKLLLLHISITTRAEKSNAHIREEDDIAKVKITKTD